MQNTEDPNICHNTPKTQGNLRNEMLNMVMEMRTEQARLAALRLLQLVELLDLGSERTGERKSEQEK